MSLFGCFSDVVDISRQTGVCKEEANVVLDRRLANLGIVNLFFMDLAQLHVEGNDENHGQQCTGLAELSFRIETPGDFGSKLGSLDVSISGMSEKGTEAQADSEALSSARESQFEVLALQSQKPEKVSKENIPAVNPASFSRIDEELGRALNNGGATSSDLVLYTPNLNNTVGGEVRERSYEDADCSDGKVMKIGGILLRKASFPMRSSRQKMSSLLNRDYQSQVFSRSTYEPAKAGCKDKCGIEVERAIACPRASEMDKVSPAPTQEREEPVNDEDLYHPPEIHPYQTLNIKTPFYLSDSHKVPSLEEDELYPVLVDDKPMLGQGFVGSSFPSENDPYSLGGKERFPHQISRGHQSSAKANNPFSSNAGAEGYSVDQFNHPLTCFAEPHDCFHTRFQNLRCHPNEQYAADLYCSQQPSGNGACVLPMASHQFTDPSHAARQDINPRVPLNYAPYTNTCHNQHACMQPTLYMPNSGRQHFCAPTCAQHLPMSYQPWHAEDQCLQCTSYERCPINLPQRGPRKQQLHGGASVILQSQSRDCLARKEDCPPLPGLGAPPYVLCQGCYKVLQVPDYLHNRSVLQRIRCSACGRISKFCNVLHTQYQALLQDGFKHRSHLVPTRMGLSEQSLVHDVQKTHMPAELDRRPKSSYGYSDLCNKVDKYSCIQGNGTPVSSYDVEKLYRSYHPRLPAPMSMEQRPCEGEWRYGTNYGLAGSSGKAPENYLPFTVNGSCVPTNAAAYPSYKMQQNGRLPTSDTQYAELSQGKEAFNTSRFADNFIKEQRDGRVRVSSGELQSLSLGCPQEGSRDGNTLLKHVDRYSLQQGRGKGVGKNGFKGASFAPVPGSPLHKHLSYDTASDFVKWAYKHEEKGKQTDSGLSEQETSKGSKFLSGLLKKNISEFGRGRGSNKNWKVVINGQTLPYAAVKSAEKQAGTIRPGIYWYDYQAGFWGVVGGPCLGIIPPSIAEFNFPLAKGCAGGTTGVFVNGRELHKKDLDVLAGRGLPRAGGKSYMVDISGQVVDQESGQLLRSLGRLAPTIERKGRGCGMFQPPTQN